MVAPVEEQHAVAENGENEEALEFSSPPQLSDEVMEPEQALIHE